MDYREDDLCRKFNCTQGTIRIYMARSTMANVAVNYNNGDRIYKNMNDQNIEELSRLIHRNVRKKRQPKSRYLKEAYSLRKFSLNEYVVENCPALDVSYLCKDKKLPCQSVDDCVIKQLSEICKKDRDMDVNRSTTEILKLLKCREIKV